MAFVRRVEALVDQQPRVGDDEADIQLAEIFDDDVGARRFQRIPAPVPVDADHQPEAAAPPGFHPGDGVLDDHGPGGRDLQPAHRFQRQRGGRLARDVAVQGRLPVDDVVEGVREPGGGQQRAGVPGGGGQHHGDPAGLQPAEQVRGAGEGPDRVGAEQFLEQFVLACREPEGGPLPGAVRG